MLYKAKLNMYAHRISFSAARSRSTLIKGSFCRSLFSLSADHGARECIFAIVVGCWIFFFLLYQKPIIIGLDMWQKPEQPIWYFI